MGICDKPYEKVLAALIATSRIRILIYIGLQKLMINYIRATNVIYTCGCRSGLEQELKNLAISKKQISEHNN